MLYLLLFVDEGGLKYKTFCKGVHVWLCPRSFDDEVLVHNNLIDYETVFENTLYSTPENVTAFVSLSVVMVVIVVVI